MKKSNKKIISKAKLGIGVALSAVALSISIDNVSAAEINDVLPEPVKVESEIPFVSDKSESKQSFDSTSDSKINSVSSKKSKTSDENLSENSSTDGTKVKSEVKDSSLNKKNEINKSIADANNNNDEKNTVYSTSKTKPVIENSIYSNSSTELGSRKELSSKLNINSLTNSKPVSTLETPEIKKYKVPNIFLTNTSGERILFTDSSINADNVNSSDSAFKAITEAFKNPLYNGVIIDRNLTLDMTGKEFNFDNSKNSNDFTFTIGNDRTLIFDKCNNGTPLLVRLGDNGKFTLDNQGKFILNNGGRPIDVRGGVDSIFTMSGNYILNDDSKPYDHSKSALKNGTTFINKNTEYAISTESGFSGTFNINNTKLITDSTDKNAESAVYIGQNKNVRLNVDNSRLDMMNNSEISSSQAFLSNAGNIVFNNSIINSGSKAHYNFDAYSSAGTEAQNITFNNSKLTLTIPEGTHPVKKVWIFDIPRRLVGMNMRNDNIVFNNSVLKEDDQRKEFSNPKATLEFDYSKVTSNNSVLDIPTIGFDNNGKMTQEHLFQDLK